MNYIKDILYVNKHSFLKTIKSLSKTWPIIFTGFIYSIISIVIYRVLNMILIGPLGIIGGFLSLLIISSLISNYLYLLTNIINYDRFTLNDFKEGFTQYIWKVYGVFFFIYLIQLVLGFVTNVIGVGGVFISFIVTIGIFVMLNPIPETIYLKSYAAWDSITYTIDFIIENFLNWALPNIVIFALLYLITGQIITSVFAMSFRYNLGLNSILSYTIGQIVFNFAMIYRGHLYKMLSGSTRRKRMFMNKF